MSDSENTQDGKAMPPASTGSLAWIPVSERLPGGREEVLGWQTWVPNEGWSEGVFVCHRGTQSGEWYSEEGQLPNITHWMPLPAPPTDAK